MQAEELKKTDDMSPSVVVKLDLHGYSVRLAKGCFENFTKLETLNLSKTDLDSITRKQLKGLKSLKILDLSNNKFEMLNLKAFDDLENLAELRLQNNPWNCGCDKNLLYILKTKLRNIDLGPVPATCHSPEEFKSRNIKINKYCHGNECSRENDCDDAATCTNTEYSYKCECTKNGFEDLDGDGKACTDINECARENDCSTKGGVCINTHGSYRCSCKKGFDGDGKNCVDVDECEIHDCGQGECDNKDGSFVCTCRDGYEENDQRVCVDIDECKYNNSCDSIEHSYCINEEKIVRGDDGYDCLCKTGYRKVGKSCVSQGNMKGLIKMIAMISGGFVGILFLIIISTVIFLKCKNRKPKPEKKEEQPVVMAPVVAMDPLVDFGYLGMPQGGQAEEEWGDELDDDDDLD